MAHFLSFSSHSGSLKLSADPTVHSAAMSLNNCSTCPGGEMQQIHSLERPQMYQSGGLPLRFSLPIQNEDKLAIPHYKYKDCSSQHTTSNLLFH